MATKSILLAPSTFIYNEQQITEALQNSVQYLRWSVLQKNITFTQHSTLDVWHGSEYTIYWIT